ncbi:hypothetical protein [Streptomyces sp. C10-9-1]|uniref:hypothetical protein n=1 Tax=Streptomyces sp. C10-9-1 TaxID=1859285 RepID=UPI003F4A1DB6
MTLWDALHTLARATALSWRGAGRGLAEHWGALKYTQALAGGRDSFLGLTDEGHRIANHHKSLQSGEFGIGFARTLTEHMLRSRFPDHTVTVVPADTTLCAGWALTSRDKGEMVKYRYRPPVLRGDLAAGRAVPLGPHRHVEPDPGLLFSTQLPTDGGTMTVHALQAPGGGGRLDPAEGREGT